MERKKIAFACFFGGSITTAALWLLLPAGMINILAILAGFCAGYLSYEFREVLAAIPKAFWATTSFSYEVWNESVDGIKKWIKEPHPFLYLSILLGLPFAVKGSWIVVRSDPHAYSHQLEWFAAFTILFGFFTTLLPFVLLWPFARLGAWHWEKSFWRMKCVTREQEIDEDTRCKNYQESGLIQKKLNYKNAYRWVGEGMLLVVLACIALPFFISYHVIRFVIKFGYQL